MISPKRFEQLGEETSIINGRHVYTGKVHEYADDNPVEFEVMIKRMLAYSAAASVPAVAAGCLRAPGLINTWWVIIPYGAYVLTALAMLLGSVRLLVNEKPLIDRIYKRTAQMLPPRCGAHALFSCILILTYFINLLVSGDDSFDLWQCILLPVLVICSGIIAYCAYRFVKNIHWT